MMLTKFSDDINVRLEPMKPETAGYFYYNRDRGKKRFCVTTFEDSLKVLFTNDYYYSFYRSIRRFLRYTKIIHCTGTN